MKKPLILYIFIIGLIITSCKKHPKCDDARICVKNIGTDTLHFSWNSNLYNLRLNPGQETCRNVGPLKGGNSIPMYFNTTKGDNYIKVSECDQKMDIQ